MKGQARLTLLVPTTHHSNLGPATTQGHPPKDRGSRFRTTLLLCNMITREPRLDSRKRSAEMTDGILVMGQGSIRIQEWPPWRFYNPPRM